MSPIPPTTFIGIDLGTSFIKGAVLDLDGLTYLHTQRFPYPSAIPGLPPLHYEVDPQAVLAATRRLIDSLLPYAPGCAGLVMCSQMHTLVLCDERGTPFSNAINWLDQRALTPHPSGKGTFFDRVLERVTPAEIRQLGNELRPGVPLCAMFTLFESGNSPPPGAFASSLPDFVLANLCQTEPIIEPTHVSAHCALNLETLDWHYPLLDRLGLSGVRYPRVCKTGTVLGYFESGGQRIPCYAALGDQQTALTGALLQEGELSINASTGAQVTMISPRLEYGDYQVRPFFDGRYLKIITHIPAGRSLTVLANLLGEVARAQGINLDTWEYLLQAAEKVETTDLEIDLSFFASTAGTCGSIRNIREDNFSAGHIFRAAYENMAHNFYTQALRLSPRQEWQRLVFSGGLVQRIPLLRRLICKRLGKCQGRQGEQSEPAAYRLSPTPEDTLTGLLALALSFSGRTQSVKESIALLSEHLLSR